MYAGIGPVAVGRIDVDVRDALNEEVRDTDALEELELGSPVELVPVDDDDACTLE